MYLDTIDFVYSRSYIQPPPITWELLRRILENRSRLLAPFQAIDIQRCFIHREWVNELKMLGPKMIWDGIEDVPEDDGTAN